MPSTPSKNSSRTPDTVDQVAGEPPVPISLWRTARTADDAPDLIGVRLAAAIITSYANVGDTVADHTTSPTIASACAGSGRRHTTDPDPGEAALVVADRPETTAAAAVLLGEVSVALRPGGCLILVDPADAGPVDLRPMHAAAAAVGLAYFQHIVAVAAQADGDRFVYYPTPAELEAAAEPAGSGHVRVHRDLRVYLRRAGDADA
ncbi:hypothetical protein GCM10010123_19880 [Pilimelia anulata]|uniref:Uncharacterized protein n=1 Tax=Pilimelia anulata TaxID=53371 RepID=A0A8J3F8M0_9ACTN|nr:hypothetical protein [Pilimelia anulata]GGJ90062.1 hypothetical protein GCM10010123_19880 [Pilimelia anulata]